MNEVDLTNATDPTNDGGTPSGGNLVANDNTQPIVTVPPGGNDPTSTTPVSDIPVNADNTVQPDPNVAPAVEPDDSVQRLEQQVSDLGKTIAMLGIDPNGEFANRLQRGLVSPEELQAKLGNGGNQNPSQPEPSVQDSFSKLIQAAKEGEYISKEDYIKSLEVMSNFVAGETAKSTQNDQMALIENCMSSAKSVISADERHTSLPADLKLIEENMFVLATDNMVGEQANAAIQRNQLRSDQRESFFTPENYKYYGARAQESFGKLRDHYVQMGYDKREAELNPPPSGGDLPTGGNPPNNLVNPISSNSGTGPTLPQGEMLNVNNMGSAARNYMANANPRV